MNRVSSPADLIRAARLAGVSDDRVLKVIHATQRAGFAPAGYVNAAYHDEPIPIGYGQVTT